MYALFTIPSNALAQIGSTSAPVFEDLFPVVALVGGILLAITIAVLIIRMLMHK